jgi:hypothetical protein
MYFRSIFALKAAPCLTQVADAGLPPRRRGFDPRPVYMGFVVNKVALGQVFLRVLHLSPVSIIPPMLHSSSFICLLLSIEKRNGRRFGHFRKATEEDGMEKQLHFVFGRLIFILNADMSVPLT